MSRIIPLWGAIVAAVVGASPSFAAEKAEDVLAGKELRRSGEMYVLRAEDDVKKAADAVEARLKEYRYAVARDQAATREAAAKKSMASNLTKQRSALRQQMAQTLPQLRAQIQNLTQQRTALRQQLNELRYANSVAGTAAYNQLADSYNALNNQIQTLVEQNNQLVDTDSEAAERIEQLSGPSSDPTRATLQTSASPEDRSDAYSQAVEALRKLVDETKTQYETLAADAEVKGALETLNQKSPRIKYVLGPSRKYLDSVKALEEAEAKGKLTPSEVAPTKAAIKRKSKPTTKKKARSVADAPAAVKSAPADENP